MFTLFLAGSLIETFPSINNFPLIRIIESLVEYFATRNLLTFIVITFFIACALSIISEFVALQFLTSDDKVDNLFLMSAIANFASYVVQAIIVWAWVIWIW